ncbi:MAG: HdeD family acid-resistance protein [Saprospiraceae bacterium]
MLQILAKQWWVVALRGAVALAFAAFVFLARGFSYDTLVGLIGLFLLADGHLAAFSGWALRGHDKDWWVAFLEGVIGIGLGAAALLTPEIAADRLLLYLALWCLLTGAFEIMLAYRVRKEITNEWLLALAGGISMVVGLLLVFQPPIVAISIGALFGLYALFFGLLMIGLGLRLRRWS